MVRAVIFDIGNVLLDFSHERMCRQLAQVYGAAAETIRKEIFDSGFAQLYDRGEVSTEELWRRMASIGSREAPFSEACEAVTDIFQPKVEVARIVERLTADGMRLVVLSNTCEVHSTHVLRTFSVFEHFDELVLSHQVGAVKPEEPIFRRAVEAANCDPADCFYTDDIADYVRAAKRLGIDGEAFRGASLLREQLRRRGVTV